MLKQVQGCCKTKCKMFWVKIENIIGETIPDCIKNILTKTGYDTLSSLKQISVEKIENHVNENWNSIIQKFDCCLECCHHDYYQNQKPFRFLPGHHDLLLTLSQNINQYTEVNCRQTNGQNT